MSVIGLDDRYLISIDFLIEQPNKEQEDTQVFQTVATELSNMTLSSLKNLIANTSQATLLNGFENFQAANIWQMKDLMLSSSFTSIMETCVSALSTKIRSSIKPEKTYNSLGINIKESDFIEFTLQENIGLTLPMFRLVIMIHDKSLLKYINSSTKIKFSFGENTSSLTTFNAAVYNVVPQDLEDKISLTIHGVLDAGSYLSESKRIEQTGSSLDILDLLLPQYNLKLNTNISQTDDYMAWKQYNISPALFFADLWLHSYINMFHQTCTSITSTGKFNFIDIQKMRDEGIKQFVLHDKLYFKPDAIYSIFGSMNKTKFIYDVNNDCMTQLLLNDTEGLVKTKVNPQLSGDYSSSYSILTPDVHKHWYEAAMLNKSRLYSCINQNAWTSMFGHWESYNVTDVVATQSTYSEDCGKYLILGKLLSITDRDFSTYVQLGRTTYSQSTGNFNA